MILVSPAEPKLLRQIGNTSAVPERYGADFLITANKKMWGVQRKTWKDLLASIADDRLAKELLQVQSLDHAVLVVEGKPRWTTEGQMMDVRRGGMSKQAWVAMLWSIRLKGLWVDHTTDMADTIRWVRLFEEWAKKAKHTSLETRNKPRGPWGMRPDDADWGKWMLQSIPGVGPKAAKLIHDKYGLPLKFTITDEQLQGIDGIGPKKAAQIRRVFDAEG